MSGYCIDKGNCIEIADGKNYLHKCSNDFSEMMLECNKNTYCFQQTTKKCIFLSESNMQIS